LTRTEISAQKVAINLFELREGCDTLTVGLAHSRRPGGAGADASTISPAFTISAASSASAERFLSGLRR
jgi:hypothetical protein